MSKLSKPGVRTRRLRDRSGQALVEFAFVLMMMLVLILGLVDFARLFLTFQVVTNATREGAREAVVANDKTDAQVYDLLLSWLAAGGIDTSGAVLVPATCTGPSTSVTVVTIHECNWSSPTTGDEVRVGVAVPFEFALVGPFIGWATGDRSIVLRSSFFMRNE